MAEYFSNCNEIEERINKMLKKSEVILNAGKEPPLTEEEWFCNLSTKDKADFFNDLIAYCFGIGHMTSECKKYEKIVDDPEKWLKQPHREVEE